MGGLEGERKNKVFNHKVKLLMIFLPSILYFADFWAGTLTLPLEGQCFCPYFYARNRSSVYSGSGASAVQHGLSASHQGAGAASGGFPVFQASDGQAAVGDVAVYPAADGAFVGNIHSLAVISLDDEMED